MLDKTSCPKRVQASDVRGIWLPMLLYWDDRWRLDSGVTDANLDRQLATGPHGIYTLDTASEFFTLEFHDWRFVAERFVARVRREAPQLPIGLGCTWTNMEGALARIRCARDLGVDVIHLAPPYWVPLNRDGLLAFFDAVNQVAGHLGVVIYIPAHGSMKLDATFYEQLVVRAPCVIGTKTDGGDTLLLAAPSDGPRHSHFAGEQKLADSVRHGAAGCYSSLAGIRPRLVKRWWDMLEQELWMEAQAVQNRVNRFYLQAVQPIRDRGILAGAIDKSLAQAGGALGGRLVRPPYQSVPADLYAGLKRAAEEFLDAV